MASDSPFLKYRDILVHQSYSAAGALQDFALSCYNGSLGQFRGDSIGNFDTEHFQIFLELVNYYRLHGENDQHLLDVGAAIWKSRRERGRKQTPRRACRASCNQTRGVRRRLGARVLAADGMAGASG